MKVWVVVACALFIFLSLQGRGTEVMETDVAEDLRGAKKPQVANPNPVHTQLGDFKCQSYSYLRSEQNWMHASEHCRRRGQFLFSPTSEEHFQHVIKSLRLKFSIIKPGNSVHIWLAASDLFKQNEFIWFPKGQKVSESQLRFLRPELTDENGSKNCLVLSVGVRNQQVLDFSCGNATVAIPLCQLH